MGSGTHRLRTVGLLLGTGSLIGATFPLGKLAAAAGVPPAAWAWATAAGAGVLLLGYALATGRAIPLGRPHLRYYAVAGAVSFAGPNLLLFAAIPRLGAGLASAMLTLSPILTLAFSLALGVRRPDRLGVAGIAAGLAGALLIVLSRGEVGGTGPAAPGWVAAGLLVPALLAVGNVYRTVDWPEGADPLALAAGSNLAAAGMLLAAVAVLDWPAGIAALAGAPGLTAAQVLASGVMLALFFRLQAAGGPVYLSQVGYVAAAVGLVSGTLLLGERYPLTTWLGALVVAGGVGLVTWSQAREAAAARPR